MPDAPLPADLIVDARWVLPMAPGAPLLHDHSVVVRHGRIVEVADTAQVHRRYHAAEHVLATDHALLPGLVNTHTHAAMTLLRGLADDLPLDAWLREHIWPAEQRHASGGFVYDGALLAAAEFIRGGITCFADMYFFPDHTARAVRAAGLRAVIGLPVLDFPSAWAQGPDEYLSKGLAVHDSLAGEARLTTAFAPHAPYTVGDTTLERIATLAAELDLPVHMHVHETAHEIGESMARYGVRPLERLAGLGLLGPGFLAVHATQLLAGEIEALARTGVHVAHCPESNMKLASGICPVTALRQAGVNVAIGTDGAASNNDLDLLGELRTTGLLAKVSTGNPAALPAQALLEMATIGGARALGLDGDIGSLEPGKAADMVAVDLGALLTQPVYDPASALVYAVGRDAVTHVWVAGRQLLAGKRYTTLDEQALASTAKAWGDRVQPASR